MTVHKDNDIINVKVEMPILPILAKMESIGVGFINEVCQRDREIIQKKLQYLEEEAYKLTDGKTFNLTSPAEVAEAILLIISLLY
jgi:DNA polymerase I-like protein with 3'-5' exonuclease and polymerase domains